MHTCLSFGEAHVKGTYKTSLSMKTIEKYFELKVATSICQFNVFKKQWPTSVLFRNRMFPFVMSHDYFPSICAFSKFYPCYDFKPVVKDRL